MILRMIIIVSMKALLTFAAYKIFCTDESAFDPKSFSCSWTVESMKARKLKVCLMKKSMFLYHIMNNMKRFFVQM